MTFIVCVCLFFLFSPELSKVRSLVWWQQRHSYLYSCLYLYLFAVRTVLVIGVQETSLWVISEVWRKWPTWMFKLDDFNHKGRSHKDQNCCKHVYVSAATLVILTLELMGTSSLLDPDSSGPKRNCRFLLWHCCWASASIIHEDWL